MEYNKPELRFVGATHSVVLGQLPDKEDTQGIKYEPDADVLWNEHDPESAW